MAELFVAGFRDTVLAGYLGAIGLYRAVARQLDPEATLRWAPEGIPVLCTGVLGDEEALLDWIWSEYRPSPIASPWNSGAGFFGSSKAVVSVDGERRNGVELVAATSDPRLQTFRTVLAQGQALLKETGYPDSGLGKPELLRRLRARLADEALEWLDAAAIVEADDDAAYPGLLGTGGNDGRLDLGNNYMLRLCTLLPIEGSLARRPRNADAWSRALLGASVFDRRAEGQEEDSVGQFAPASRETPNGSSTGLQSFQAGKLSNPWDLIWALEGSLWFAGAATRRLASHGSPRAAFPFHADRVGSDYGSAIAGERGRDELWLPLWGSAASLPELQALFGEARAQVGRRRAASGVDFARAIAALGTVRGLAAFRRYAILERAGQSSLAVCVGRYTTGESPAADRLRELDRFSRAFERLARHNNAPPRIGAAWSRYLRAVFTLTRQPEDPRRLSEVVAAVGAMERELARQPGLVSGERRLVPIPPLTLRQGVAGDWLGSIADGSAELRLALSLACLDGSPGDHPHTALRGYLEPDWSQSRAAARIDGAARLALVPLLQQVLRRRVIEGLVGPDRSEPDVAQRRPSGGRPTGGVSAVELQDIAAFVLGDTDEERILDLLWGLTRFQPADLRSAAWNLWRELRPAGRPPGPDDVPTDLPRAFALLRTALPPRHLELGWLADELPDSAPEAQQEEGAHQATAGRTLELPVDLDLVQPLLAGRLGEATRRAERRLVGRGLRPRTSGATPDAGLAPREIERICAAVLIPVRQTDMARLCRAVLHPTSLATR